MSLGGTAVEPLAFARLQGDAGKASLHLNTHVSHTSGLAALPVYHGRFWRALRRGTCTDTWQVAFTGPGFLSERAPVL